MVVVLHVELKRFLPDRSIHLRFGRVAPATFDGVPLGSAVFGITGNKHGISRRRREEIVNEMRLASRPRSPKLLFSPDVSCSNWMVSCRFRPYHLASQSSRLRRAGIQVVFRQHVVARCQADELIVARGICDTLLVNLFAQDVRSGQGDDDATEGGIGETLVCRRCRRPETRSRTGRWECIPGRSTDTSGTAVAPSSSRRCR